MFSIEEIKEIFKTREEWVVKGSTMDLAIADMLKILDEPFVKYNKEQKCLENTLGSDKTMLEIKAFVEAVESEYDKKIRQMVENRNKWKDGYIKLKGEQNGEPK